jgi:tRNA (guanosine-2'-O-)-methyltransferase
VIAARLSGLVVVVENLHDPHNGAAALRSCEAAGILALHAVESAAPFRFSSKVTQGCERWVRVVRHRATHEALADLRGRGFQMAAAVPDACERLETLDLARPTALWIGNEHAGLTREARHAADVEYALPMVGMTRSLNLSVAAALSVFAAAGRRRELLGAQGDLPEEEQLTLRAQWYFEDVRGADAILRRAGVMQTYP